MPDKVALLTRGFFTTDELRCGCGVCLGECNMDTEFLQMLLTFRVILNSPVIVYSGYRCPKHLLQSKNHGSGKAVDIKCADSRMRYNMIRAAIMSGFTRIGIAPNYIHLDNNYDGDQCVIWLYNKGE